MSDVKIGALVSAKDVGIGDWESLKEIALELERLGYHSVFLSDHLAKEAFRFECWTALSALSAITKKIRLGSMVLCNSFRNPSLLAKMAATLDVISGGRLEFGIGAGYYEPEHRAYGYPFPKLSVRVRQLEEALEIIKRMWTQERPSYKGRYYQIEKALCEPKPLQKPHPPITIGGGNEKYTLPVVAKYADHWNYYSSLDEFKHKLRRLETFCSQIGRDPKEMEKSAFFYYTAVYPNKWELIEDMKRVYRARKEVWDVISGPLSFEDWLKNVRARNMIGTLDQCINKMQEYVNLGATYFILRFVNLTKRAYEQPKLFSKEFVESLS